jgi:TRAP-type C4-dicarboxylate transport system substrate-binding protein
MLVFTACSPVTNNSDDDTADTGDGVHDISLDDHNLPLPTPTPSRIFTLTDKHPDGSPILKFADLLTELTSGDWKVYIVDSGESDFARTSSDMFESGNSGLFELSRFEDSVIVTSIDLWNSMTPEEQSIIMQCALEVAFDYFPFP